MPCHGINKQNKCYVDVYSVQESDMMAYKPNLLINGDFQCNQRGLSVYDYTSNGTHCLDMWHIWKMKLTVNDGYIKIENQDSTQHALNQTFGFSRKGTFTLVINVKDVAGDDAHVYMVSGGTNTRIMSLVKGINVATFTSDDFTKLCVSIPANGSMELEYIDLFDGSFAYPHVREDYVTALNRCRRYLQVYPTMYSMIEMYYSSKKFISVANFEKMQSKPNATIGSAKFYDTSMNYVSAPVSTVVCTTDTMEVRTSEATNEKHASTFTLKLFDVVISCEPL